MSIKWLPKKRCFRVRVARRVKGRKPIDRERLVYVKSGETKRQAERRAKAVEVTLGEEIAAEQAGTIRRKEPTFSMFVNDTYLPRCETERNAHGVNLYSTMSVKEDVIRKHLEPYFGTWRLNEIDRAAVEAFAAEQEAATYKQRRKGKKDKTLTYAPATLARHFKLLNHILRTAAELDLIDPARVPKVRVPNGTPRRRKASNGKLDSHEFYNESETKLLLAEAKKDGPKWHALFTVLLRVGLRIGEAIALEWEDIDFEDELVWVRRQHSYGATRPPKNGKVRHIPMHATVARVLRIFPRSSSDLVFPGCFGHSPIAASTVRRRGKKYAKAAGIKKGFWPHACRHTAASMFLAQGVPPHVVAGWLGHSVRMLNEIYAHVASDVSHHYMMGLDLNDGLELLDDEQQAAE